MKSVTFVQWQEKVGKLTKKKQGRFYDKNLINCFSFFLFLEEFKRLCLEVPVVISSNGSSSGSFDPYLINECALRPTICGGGKCIDTVHGYDCECFPGYLLSSSHICEGT